MPEAALIEMPVQVAPVAAFEDVTLTVGGRALLDRLSFELRPGGVTALVGPNGAGKSLSLRVLAGLIRPTSGHVRFAEKPPSAREMALVFQKPVLLRRSVRANLDHALATYGVPRRERPGRIAGLLRQTDLAGLADAPARRLSGGEQQRLAMARALAAGPRFLLLDEPTASLDPQATAMIEELVRRAAADGVKVLMVTHDREQAARLAGDVLFLNRGRLVEAAPARRFFEAPASREARAYLEGDLLI
ncbi:MAG TPA: ATP-binding cassette domain-containing protein [Paracoccaceae bacterium]|nr:ATP-binding cassette domain-containing protein [Paracoccaceae bacterium]